MNYDKGFKNSGTELRTTLVTVVGALVLATIAVFSLLIHREIASDFTNRMAEFRDSEMSKIRNDLKEYVGLAYQILDRHYRQSMQFDYIKETFGSRLQNTVELVETVLQNIISEQSVRLETQKTLISLFEDLECRRANHPLQKTTDNPDMKLLVIPIKLNNKGEMECDDSDNLSRQYDPEILAKFSELCRKNERGFIQYAGSEIQSENSIESRLYYVVPKHEWNCIIGAEMSLADTRDQIIIQAVERIKEIRFASGEGYFWINDMGTPFPKMIMHPTMPELNGKVMDDPSYNTAQGKKAHLFTSLVNICRENGSGFVEYLWPKPISDGLTLSMPKESYVRLFEPLNWVIGTGIYIDRIERLMQQHREIHNRQLSAIAYIIMIIGIIVLLLTFGILHVIVSSITSPITSLSKAADLMAAGDPSLPLPTSGPFEIQSLAESFNRMRLKIVSALAALRESEENLSATLRSIGDGVITCTTDGKILSLNAVAENLTGWTTSEAVGYAIEEVFHIVNYPTHDRIVNLVGQTLHREKSTHQDKHILLTARNGDEYHISINCTPICDSSDKVFGVVIVFQDITEEYARQKALKSFKEALDNATEGIVMAAPEGLLYYRNEAFDRMFGETEELQPPSIYCDETIRNEVFQTIISGGRWTGELKMFDRTRNVRNILLKAYANKDEHGKVTSIVWIHWDITDRKRAEQALFQANEQLEHRVTERTRELQKANEELKQFAYVASHDLQEPLRMITSYLQLLEKRYHAKLDSDATEFIGYAVDGAKRLHILINDLLTYSRTGSGNMQFQPVDCNKILDEALKNLEMTIRESGAEIERTPMPIVFGDGGQLMQVFQNLIGNAIKFRADHDLKITIRAEKFKGCWRFSVRDNGIGIEPRHYERIFMVFQRLHGRNVYTGTGIGLAICKKVVEYHGGIISVESQPGKGAEFFFTIPETGASL